MKKPKKLMARVRHIAEHYNVKSRVNVPAYWRATVMCDRKRIVGIGETRDDAVASLREQIPLDYLGIPMQVQEDG